MSYASFIQLVDILDLNVNETRSRASTSGNEPITLELIVAIGLWFMGGEKRKSLKDIFGTSAPSNMTIHPLIYSLLHMMIFKELRKSGVIAAAHMVFSMDVLLLSTAGSARPRNHRMYQIRLSSVQVTISDSASMFRPSVTPI